jgi:ubiquinone/menaquinone biosynthesis C-methylase UbiE
MISNPLKNIDENVASVLSKLVNEGGNLYNTTHLRRYARTVETILDDIKDGQKLLELGTSAVIPLALKNLGADVDITVTDFGYELGTTGTTTLSIGESLLDTTYYCVDLETMKLPVDDNTFDVVLCCEVIEHMDVDPMFMLSEVNRVVKPGGTLILTTPNITSSRNLWKMLRGVEPYFYMQYHRDGNRYRHNYEYSVGALTSILKAAGFSGNIWTEDNFENGIRDDLIWIKNSGFKIDESKLGDNIFAVVKKTGEVQDRYPSPVYI